MSTTLEWVRMPDGIYLRTICRDGVPLAAPTRYLLAHAYPDASSTRTVRTYAGRLLPYFVWLDRQGLALEDVTADDLRRFRRDLSLADPATPPLLRKGVDSAPSTVYYTIAAALRFMLWAMGREDTEPLLGRDAPRSRRSRIAFRRLSAPDLRTVILDILPRRKRVLPKSLTLVQLEVCRSWIMDTYAFDPGLQLRNRAIFEVMWDGALRKGALLSLRTDSIQWDEQTVSVPYLPEEYRAAWFRKSVNARAAKTGEYLLTVSNQTIQWLYRYQLEARPAEAARLGHRVFFCQQIRGRRDYGHPLTVHALEYFFLSMSKPIAQGGCGIHVTRHMLRHTWSAMARADGVPVESRQHQLGHAHPSTTEGYGPSSPETVRAELRAWRETHPEYYGGSKV